LAEIAQCHVRLLGNTLDRRAHFGPGVEEKNHIQRFFLVAETSNASHEATWNHRFWSLAV
jgi:hypothetical protein